MTIEVAVLVSVASLLFSVGFNLLNTRRANRADDQKDATAMTTMLIKLEAINESMSEIKAEMRAEQKTIKDDVRNLRDDTIKQDQSLKAAWRAIEDLKSEK